MLLTATVVLALGPFTTPSPKACEAGLTSAAEAFPKPLKLTEALVEGLAIVRVAVFCPVLLGVNVTVKSSWPPTGIVADVGLTVKCAGLGWLLMATLLMVTVSPSFDVFVSLTVWVTEVPTFRLPKLIEVGEAEVERVRGTGVALCS
ncbi:MAG TPA: hypothetical protein VD972_31400 [Hyalangium sp.]|nr:hypothetical protein [Hyalangium sp.]HYI00505.1 hypothetical protein [Hyalangium sp.]